MTTENLFNVPPSPSPFLRRCRELGIALHPSETIEAKGVTVTTRHVAQRGDIYATSKESARDAAIKLCAAVGIQFEQ